MGPGKAEQICSISLRVTEILDGEKPVQIHQNPGAGRQGGTHYPMASHGVRDGADGVVFKIFGWVSIARGSLRLPATLRSCGPGHLDAI